MLSSPANSCLLFLSPTQVVPHTPFTLWPLWRYDIYVYDLCLGLLPSHHHHDSTLRLPHSPLGGPLWEVPSGRWEVVFYLVRFALLALRFWPWRHSQKNKTSFEDIGVLSFAGLTVTGTVTHRLWPTTPTSAYLAPFDGIVVFLIFYYYFSYLRHIPVTMITGDHWLPSISLAYASFPWSVHTYASFPWSMHTYASLSLMVPNMYKHGLCA